MFLLLHSEHQHWHLEGEGEGEGEGEVKQIVVYWLLTNLKLDNFVTVPTDAKSRKSLEQAVRQVYSTSNSGPNMMDYIMCILLCVLQPKLSNWRVTPCLM